MKRYAWIDISNSDPFLKGPFKTDYVDVQYRHALNYSFPPVAFYH